MTILEQNLAPHRLEPRAEAVEPQVDRRSAAVQRVVDVLGAVSLILLLAPALVLIALCVGLTTRGGILFRQRRVGLDGRPITMLKFRTMRAHSHARRDELRALDEGSGVLFKIRQDPRVTPVGRLLRRLSLDELPQLVNVLRGDMSLVGPRPALPEEAAAYNSEELQRLRAKPGMTGLWQVSGRSDLSWEHGMWLDLYYVRNASMKLDLHIMMKTVVAVVEGRGAY